MLFPGKRGMSPLIATVLLIAFAVALGAMIMNWSSGVSSEDGALGVDCSGIAINLEQPICADENELTMNVRNTGTENIAGLELRLLNEAEDLDLSLRVKESSLIQSEAITRIVTAIVPNLDTIVEVNPLLRNEEGDLVACEPAGLIQDRLISCS